MHFKLKIAMRDKLDVIGAKLSWLAFDSLKRLS
jgi:hypothetical protein